jgi:hypothetical protein
MDEGDLDAEVEYTVGSPAYLPLRGADRWTDDESHAILTILSDAIREYSPFDEIRFPFHEASLPIHEGAPLRCYPLPEAFFIPRGVGRYECGLAARDYHRWHALWDRLRKLTARR